ncbi:MAG: hypothetical protein AABZ08_05835 [Planctomycetota bacterium]
MSRLGEVFHMMFYSLVASFVILWGQSPPAKPAEATPALADAYVDGSEEFSIRPPAGWQLNRQRIPDGRGITVLRMLGPFTTGPTEEISVRRVDVPDRRTPEKMLRLTADSLGLEFSEVRIASQQLQQIAEKQGGFVSAAYGHEGMVWRRMEAFVEVGPRSYLVLTYNGPLTTDTSRESLFQLIVSSLTLLKRTIGDAELRDALAAGQEWMASLTEGQLKQALVQPYYLRMEMGGRAVGFVAMESSEFVLDKRLGIRMLERGWTFDTGGRARSLDHSMFLALDFQNERWRSNSFTLIEATPQAGGRLECALEEGLRIQDRLSSGQSYACGAPATQNAALKLPKTYLSRVLVRLLPRLVKELDKPRRMAFTTFDHLRGDLVILIADFKGERPLPSGDSKGKTYRIDEYEGLASEASSLFVDAEGKTVFVQAGKTTLRPAEKDELEREMAARVADADRMISEIGQRYSEDQDRFKKGPIEVLPPASTSKPSR